MSDGLHVLVGYDPGHRDSTGIVRMRRDAGPPVTWWVEEVQTRMPRPLVPRMHGKHVALLTPRDGVRWRPRVKWATLRRVLGRTGR